MWGGPVTEALDTFLAHLQAKFGCPAGDPATQATRLGLHQQLMEELRRCLVDADPPPTMATVPAPTPLRVTTPAPTPTPPRTHEVGILPEIVGREEDTIREAYFQGYTAYPYGYDSEDEDVWDSTIREELRYAYYESEEENDVEEEEGIRVWIDGDFILEDRFFAR